MRVQQINFQEPIVNSVVLEEPITVWIFDANTHVGLRVHTYFASMNLTWSKLLSSHQASSYSSRTIFLNIVFV